MGQENEGFSSWHGELKYGRCKGSDKMKKWIKTAVLCLVPILLYEIIAFLAAGILWAVLALPEASGSRVGIWMTANSGLLITALAGALAAAFFLLFESRIEKEESLIKNLEKQRKYSFTGRSRFYIIIMAAGAAAFLNSILNILPFLKEVSAAYSEGETDLWSGDRVLQLLTVCLAAPAGEEWAFRGFAFRRFREKMNFSFPLAAILSSLSFGLYHGNLVQGIYAFFLGLLLCWVKEVYRTTEAPFIFHMAANGISLVMTWAGNYFSMENVTMGVVSCICSGCILAVSIRGVSREKEILGKR